MIAHAYVQPACFDSDASYFLDFAPRKVRVGLLQSCLLPLVWERALDAQQLYQVNNFCKKTPIQLYMRVMLM